MNKRVKMMMNMSESIAKINGWVIARSDLQRHTAGELVYYTLYMYYDVNGEIKEIIIRNDCTVVGYDED